jgi:hypothetical protein
MELRLQDSKDTMLSGTSSQPFCDENIPRKQNLLANTNNPEYELSLLIKLLRDFKTKGNDCSDNELYPKPKNKDLINWLGAPEFHDSNPQKSTIGTSSKTLFVSSPSVSNGDSRLEIMAPSDFELDIIQEFCFLIESQDYVPKDNVTYYKRKNLIKLLGAPEPPSNPIASKRNSKQNIIQKIKTKWKRKSQDTTVTLTTLIDQKVDVTQVTHELIQDPLMIEALEMIQMIIENRKLAKVKNEEETPELIEKLKLFGSTAFLMFQNAIGKLRESVVTTVLVDDEFDYSFESVNQRLKQLQGQITEENSNQLFIDQKESINMNQLKMIDLIRVDKKEWPTRFENYVCKDDSLLNADFVKTLYKQGATKVPHRRYAKRIQVLPQDDDCNVITKEIIDNQKLDVGINIDKILENIYGDEDFKLKVLFQPFPNHEKFPELFGPITKDDIDEFLNHVKYEELSSSITSSSVLYMDETFGDSISYFSLIHFEDEKPSSHPLDRTNEEECDMFEFNSLYENYKKSKNHYRKMIAKESVGTRQLRKLKQVLDNQETLGSKQLKRLKQVLDNDNIVKTRSRSKSVQENSNKHIKRVRSYSNIEFKDYKDVVNYIFHSEIENQVCVDGIGAEELKSWNQT